jgi:hypothetical protein
MSVKLCPAPTAFTDRLSATARRTSSATCSGVRGRTVRAGLTEKVPDQFRQLDDPLSAMMH